MNLALLAACLAMASLPPASLRRAPSTAAPDVAAEASPPADAPTMSPAAPPEPTPGETSPTPEPAPETATPPSADTPRGDAPVDPPPSSEPAPTDAPETAEPTEDPNGPPTPPATVAPTTLPSPGDIEPEGDDEPLPDEPYDPTTDSPEALQARHWIRTGAALLVVGGALTITAAVFGGTDPCRRGIGNSCQEAAARRAALAIGIPGAIMIAGGATSLAIGIVRRNQLRASVAVSRDAALVGVSGRF